MNQIVTRLLIPLIILRLVQGSPALTEELAAARNTKSANIRKYMNETADPCESFFDYACGNWKTHHAANASVTRTRSFLIAIEEFDPMLSSLLESVDETDTEAELKVKHFYESCLKVGSSKPNDYSEKLKEIASEFGQMPALVGDKWQEQDFDWLKTVADIAYKYGITIILGSSIETNDFDHSSYDLKFERQRFNGYTKPKVGDKLKKFLGFDDKTAEETAQNIVDFEDILMEAFYNSTQIENPKQMSIEDMYQKYLPDFDVKQFFKSSYGSIPSGNIYDYCPNVQSVALLMQTAPKRKAANYIFFQLLSEFMINIPQTTIELQELCISQIETHFSNIVSFMFYRSHNLKKKEQRFEHMWQDIRLTLQQILESSRLYWFDDEAREYALEKLHSLKMVVPSYTDFNFSEEYDILNAVPSDYIENLRSLKALHATKSRATLNKAPQQKNMLMSSPVYALQSNTIIIPVSVLRNDFFSSDSNPQSLNFARLGYLMGHEVLHGFSGMGRSYNKLGDFLKPSDGQLEKEYAERRQCLHDQYHYYTFGGQQLPQDELQSENAADVGGIILAYESYRKWYAHSGRTKHELELETLPNLSYTNKQLFFIYYAQTWCADTYEKERSNIAANDVHSPDEFRTFVPLTNMAEFSKAFKCPKGSPMNPVKKCKIY